MRAFDLSLSLLSLSLSHKHTHTYIHIYAHAHARTNKSNIHAQDKLAQVQAGTPQPPTPFPEKRRNARARTHTCTNKTKHTHAPFSVCNVLQVDVRLLPDLRILRLLLLHACRILIRNSLSKMVPLELWTVPTQSAECAHPINRKATNKKKRETQCERGVRWRGQLENIVTV